jgi:hypothetical protein
VTTRLAGLGSFDTPIFSKTGIKAITVNKLWSIPDWLRSATFRQAFTRPHGSLPLNSPLVTRHSPPPAAFPPGSRVFTGHWPLPAAFRQNQRVQVMRRPSPAGSRLSTDPELPKMEQGPIWPTKSSISLFTERGDFGGQILDRVARPAKKDDRGPEVGRATPHASRPTIARQ